MVSHSQSVWVRNQHVWGEDNIMDGIISTFPTTNNGQSASHIEIQNPLIKTLAEIEILVLNNHESIPLDLSLIQQTQQTQQLELKQCTSKLKTIC